MEEARLHRIDDHRRLIADNLLKLRALQADARRYAMTEVDARISEVINRVEQDIFRIAVVGEFKRGKSTLINALLGQEILPADVLPCSATLNRITYGLTPSVRLFFRDGKGGPTEETIAIDALSSYVTKLTPDSERRASDIEEAVVYHPTRYCRDKADIIDTPGLNDDEAMTQVTMSILPRVDAALFVILAQSPFSGYEGDFLNRLLTNDLGRVIFVVNRMDEIRRESDRARILQLVRDRIEKAVKTRGAELHGEGTPAYNEFLRRLGTPKVFGVSGGVALDAKIDGDQAALEKSGFPVFEAALERFLLVERGMVTLQMLADVGLSSSRKLLHQASIRRSALHMQADDFQARYASTSEKLTQLRAQLQEQLSHLRKASEQLRSTLRARAAALPEVLIAEANEAIRSFPLDADAISKANLQGTTGRMNHAVVERMQVAARREAEKTQLELEKGLQAQVAHLASFSQQLEQQLSEIQLSFHAADEGAGAGIGLGAGMIGAAFGGWLVGGVLGGAFNGYQLAGARGAVAGAAAGAAVGFGATMAGGLMIGLLGLPLTWPVVLPTLAMAGLASSFGARWFTNAIFGGEQVERFRESFRQAVIGKLEASSAQRVGEVERATDAQVKEAFTVLRRQVEQELGGAIEQTQRTLNDLQTSTTRSETQREQELIDLDRSVAQANEIQQQMGALGDELRRLQEA